MRITFIDDSMAYDSETPLVQPMGGLEKAVAYLAPALAKRGHEVCVMNTREDIAHKDGVSWIGLDHPYPPESDVVIALKKPKLFNELPDVERKILWLGTPAQVLNKPRQQDLMDRHNPILVFLGDSHYNTWRGWKEFRKALITPAVAPAYLGDSTYAPVEPPRAIVTNNPLHGVDALVDLWVDAIVPQLSQGGELHIYSAGLFKAQQGAEVPEKLRPIADKVLAAADQGVKICKPLADPDMMAAYMAASCHLYSGAESEIYCATLADSQAAGLPAVVRSFGAAAERVQNGQTGFLVPDVDGMANVAAHLMNRAGSRQSMSEDCRTLQRGRTWERVAVEFEAYF